MGHPFTAGPQKLWGLLSPVAARLVLGTRPAKVWWRSHEKALRRITGICSPTAGGNTSGARYHDALPWPTRPFIGWKVVAQHGTSAEFRPFVGWKVLQLLPVHRTCCRCSVRPCIVYKSGCLPHSNSAGASGCVMRVCGYDRDPCVITPATRSGLRHVGAPAK